MRMLLSAVVLCSVLICLSHSTLADGEEEKTKEKKETSAKDTDKEQARVIKLEDIVVTPTRSEEDVFNTPFAAGSYSMPKLQLEQMARTLPEALLDEPGIMVQKTAHGHGSPFIRGLTGYRTLLLVDGIRINNSVFRSGPNQYWTTVDIYSLERLEVVKGPASVLYGSDALGGVVNGITLSPVYSSEDTFGGRVLYRGASSEQSNTERLETRTCGKKSAASMLDCSRRRTTTSGLAISSTPISSRNRVG